MISFYNTHGKVSMTSSYFSALVSRAVQSGFGVAGMAHSGTSDSLKSLVAKNSAGKGVRVREEEGHLVIDLHIKVSYGLNIAETVRSVSHRVKYVVEEATGLAVKNIHVSVDDIVA